MIAALPRRGVATRIARGIGMTAFDKLVIAATQLVLVPVLATRWGLERYGLWLLLATVPQFLGVSDLGFATAAGTRMTMAAARGDRDEALRLFQSAWRAILASSAAMLGLVALGLWLVPADMFGGAPRPIADDPRLTLALLALYGVMAVQGGILFAGFRAAGLFTVGAFWNAMVLLIENGALVVAVILGGGLSAAAGAWLAGRSLGLAGQALLLRRRVPWLILGWRRGSWPQARGLLAPALAVMLMPLAQAAVLQGTALMLGLAAGRGAVPAFAAARTLSRVGMQLCWIASTPVMPEFSAAVARGDRRAMAAMQLALIAFSAGLVLPFAVGFSIFGAGAIQLWTHGAIAAPQGLVLFMGLALLCGGFWYPVSNLILACNRHAGYTTRYALLALVSLPAAYGAAHAWGASGAAGVMAALDALMLVVVARLAARTLCTRAELRATLADMRVRWRGRPPDRVSPVNPSR